MTTQAQSPHPGLTEPIVRIADPSPLGLAAFALTTFLLSTVNAGILTGGVKSIVLSSALFYGGAVQVAAGMWEFRKGNTFGATAFSSYGAFWLSYWGLDVFFKPAPGVSASDVSQAMGMFLLAWLIFTAILLVASLRTTGVLALTLIALTVTLALLAIGEFQQSSSVIKVGGYLGIITAVLAWYGALAAVVNDTWKKPVLPVFHLA